MRSVFDFWLGGAGYTAVLIFHQNRPRKPGEWLAWAGLSLAWPIFFATALLGKDKA